MNRPVQATDTSNMALAKPAGNGNSRSSGTESPFSMLLGTSAATETRLPKAADKAGPVADETRTATPPAAELTDVPGGEMQALAGLAVSVQVGAQAGVVSGELSANGLSVSVAGQTVAMKTPEAGLQTHAAKTVIAEALSRKAEVATEAVRGQVAQGATPDSAPAPAGHAGAEAVAPVKQGAQPLPLVAMQGARLLQGAGGTEPAPEHPVVDSRRRGTVPAADTLLAQHRMLAASSGSVPEIRDPGRERMFSAELNRLITGIRGPLVAGIQGALVDGTALPAQGPVTVNGTFALDVSGADASFTPAAIRGQVTALVGQAGWDRAIGEQALWFASQNIRAASLRLNPAHLGPMEMTVAVDGDRANVAFASHSTIVRDALESAIPRLREMLAENGLNLVDVNVSHRGLSDRRDQEASGMSIPHDDGLSDPGPDNGHAGTADLSAGIRAALGLVDYYV